MASMTARSLGGRRAGWLADGHSDWTFQPGSPSVSFTEKTFPP